MLNRLSCSKAEARSRAIWLCFERVAPVIRRALAAWLVVLPLMWCVAANDLAEDGTASMSRHVVTDVTSFLRAIGSDRTIELAAGEYLLDPAAAAGQTSPHWLFEDCEFAENTWRRGKYEPYQPPPPADYRGN